MKWKKLSRTYGIRRLEELYNIHNILQHDGLAMGAPTSSILSEFYLQHLENSKIYDILLNCNIVGYFRYVDDLLIIYNERKTDKEDLLYHFNNITPKLNFTIEKEMGDSINFLFLTIHRDINSFSVDIYRKPTYTYTIIPIDSCHPTEHKYAAIRHLQNRLNSYQLSHEKREKERKIIQDILHNNGYNTSVLKSVSNSKKHKNKTERTHWSKFTYFGKETRAVTKVFKNTRIKITYSTKNTLEKLLTKKHHPLRDKYDNSGIYQLTCPTSSKKYTGQTGRSFRTGFQEHLGDFRHENGKSSFAQHLLDNGHDAGPIEDIMNTLHITSKGRLMDTMEKFYIFRETKLDHQINTNLQSDPM
jgi:hypothetical protein